MVGPDDAGARVDKLVAEHLGVSRSRVQIESVTVDGHEARVSDRPGPGAEISVTIICETDTHLVGDAVGFDIVYADVDLVVVDKPAGVSVHPPATDLGRPSLIGALIGEFPEIAELSTPDTAERPGVVHRIDRGTSGLLVVARSQTAFDGLQRQVRGRRFDRHYAALVSGHFETATGTIDAALARRAGKRTFEVDPEGRHATTHYEVVAGWERPEISLVDARLETGRTHQIRVHMQAIGHPIVGDKAYRGRMILGAQRQFLHARHLGFEHPVTGARVECDAALPADLREVLEAAGVPESGGVPQTWH